MGRRRRHEEHDNHERWLVSYADMVTLLMVFFIVLYASSQINVSKYRAIHEAAADSLGAGPRDTNQVVRATNRGGDAPDGPTVVKEPGKETTQNPDDRLLARLRHEVKKAGLENAVKVYRDPRGIVVYFTDRVLFHPGSADVLPAGASVLRRLSPILAQESRPVVVEGHTDNQPISTPRYPSNWELSTARATQVLRNLLNGGVAPERVAASGYADTHPKASNATAAGRRKNRRVEVVVVTGTTARTAAYATGVRYEKVSPAGTTLTAGEPPSGHVAGTGDSKLSSAH